MCIIITLSLAPKAASNCRSCHRFALSSCPAHLDACPSPAQALASKDRSRRDLDKCKTLSWHNVA